MKVKRNKETESGKFELPGGGHIHLRLLGMADIKELDAECISIEDQYPLLEDENGKKEFHHFAVERNDPDKRRRMTLDRTITGWDGITEEDGTPTPCTAENKEFLYLDDLEFATAYSEGIAALRQRSEKKAEALEKNSLSGSSGQMKERPSAKVADDSTQS